MSWVTEATWTGCLMRAYTDTGHCRRQAKNSHRGGPPALKLCPCKWRGLEGQIEVAFVRTGNEKRWYTCLLRQGEEAMEAMEFSAALSCGVAHSHSWFVMSTANQPTLFFFTKVEAPFAHFMFDILFSQLSSVLFFSLLFSLSSYCVFCAIFFPVPFFFVLSASFSLLFCFYVLYSVMCVHCSIPRLTCLFSLLCSVKFFSSLLS